ncbi:MAG: hypothetical protein PQJ50_12995, partial [Spirochaetales bacterium]|nr:hypothetical protein [Spirochaetales bacterium]
MNSMILGIDAGSVSLSAVLVDETGDLHESFTTAHEGNIRDALKRMEDTLDLSNAGAVALTGRSGGRIRHSRVD